MTTRLWALAGMALCELSWRTHWAWAWRMEDAVYRRHQAAQIERERSGG